MGPNLRRGRGTSESSDIAKQQESYLITVTSVTHFIQHDQTVGFLWLLPHQVNNVVLEDFVGHGANDVVCLSCKEQCSEPGT